VRPTQLERRDGTRVVKQAGDLFPRHETNRYADLIPTASAGNNLESFWPNLFSLHQELWEHNVYSNCTLIHILGAPCTHNQIVLTVSP
jgi:hypothetical protein